MNSLGDQFDRQKQYFASGITRSYPWRIEQLDRVARLVGENEAALQDAVAHDFKTASQEKASSQTSSTRDHDVSATTI
jgi:aldehyde dehydrogenase (NAD+)